MQIISDALRAKEAVASSVCNLCGSTEQVPLVEKLGLTVVQCTGCGLAFTDPQPIDTVKQYTEEYFRLYARRRAFRLKRMARRLRCIELLKQRGRLLDIGCSLGYSLEAASELGWEACGLDISDYAVSEARKSGCDAKSGLLKDANYPAESFDCVTMWDVLEHVPDPSAHMREVWRVLKPGGLVAIGTPDIGHPFFKLHREKWRHLKPSEHLYYFNRSTLAGILSKSGFRQVWPRLYNVPTISHIAAGFCQMIGRVTRANDVLVAYGVKDEWKENV